jgi:mandelate racemase
MRWAERLIYLSRCCSVGAEDLHGHRAIREAVRPVPIQTGENWWFPRGMANAIAAKASDLAMVDVVKIGGITGWISAAGQAEAASLPLSSHSYNEASAHAMACSPTVSWCEYLDLAGAVLAELLLPNKGKITPPGARARPGMGRGGGTKVRIPLTPNYLALGARR